MAGTYDAHLRYAENALAEDHARHRDVVSPPTDRPATKAPTNPRPMWANTQEVALAQQVRRWIDQAAPADQAAVTANMAGRLHEEVARTWPDAKRLFGMDALLAATGAAHTDDCRWLPLIRRTLARRVHGDDAPLPSFTKALVGLLGPPCRLCIKTLRGMANGRVHSSGRRETRAGRGAPVHVLRRSPSSLSASISAHAGKPCAVCYAARRGERQALVAAAAPHAPVLAPTGRVRLVPPPVHNGVGKTETCGCAECRGSRILAWHRADEENEQRKRRLGGGSR